MKFPALAVLAGLCFAAALVQLVCGFARPADALVYFPLSACFSALGIVTLVRAAGAP